MALRTIIVLAVLAASAHTSALEESRLPVEYFEHVMATEELNPSHYPAQRAAKVVIHYLNSRYGSPFKWFGLYEVLSAKTEDVLNTGRRYLLEILVEEIDKKTQQCSAVVFFPYVPHVDGPSLRITSCEEVLKGTTNLKEIAFYQEFKNHKVLPETHNLPDNYGNIKPEMEPFRYLAHAASSYIMLEESTEDTLYNMAQVASIKQLPTENEQLKFECVILLHDMVSQEILQWKMLFTWSFTEGTKVLQKKQMPRM